MPGRRVLCVTFRWHDFRISGPLAEAAVTPPGHDVTVGWRLLDAPSPEEADQFLVSLWRHLDAELDQAGGHRLV
ncbi:hypothetical protein A3C96_03900 [Candidatus Uhrbacteria bacterium RIFCSPHIGHO2_02_FULL_60_10]|uniref:Uncharacterized protein n=1 Tax=Candidatus Uhrbacteria bacterium RIFCSPHIGHO2_02_FULL_60_10 TaxID=1802392 RepID=A0A1F7U8Y4_9BACT|nr:MAG: hypothetical protein A3C96_03900 [Candidatus Uhrbacteria bacterium RIFCSPHIGHO2_02_FULL_60_10]